MRTICPSIMSLRELIESYVHSRRSDHANFKWKTIAHLFFFLLSVGFFSPLYLHWIFRVAARKEWQCFVVASTGGSVSVDVRFCKCGHYSFQYRLLRALQCVFFFYCCCYCVTSAVQCLFVSLMKDSCNRPI